MSYRALYNASHRRYLTEFWNFRYDLQDKRKENYLYIWKCNNITNYSKKEIQETTAYLKLQVPKINYDFQIIKKFSFKN